MNTIDITAAISLDDLAVEISYIDRDKLFEFIKQLDLSVADLEFTERLRDYLISECDKEYVAGAERS